MPRSQARVPPSQGQLDNKGADSDVNVHHAPKVEPVHPNEPLLMNLLPRGIVDGQTSVRTRSRWPTMHPESPLVCSTPAEMARGHRWTICVLPLAGAELDRRAKGEVALLVLGVGSGGFVLSPKSNSGVDGGGGLEGVCPSAASIFDRRCTARFAERCISSCSSDSSTAWLPRFPSNKDSSSATDELK